jgi:hypothetical protein
MGTKKNMEERRRLAPAKVWGTTLAILLTGAAGVARAQAADAPPPAAPAAPPAAEAAPPPPPAVVVVPPATPPAAVATEAKPPTSAEAMPATRPDVLPPIDVGAWLRAGSSFQSATDPSKINDWHMDSAYVELHAGGKITKTVGVTLNLNANITSGSAASITGFNAAMMDGSPPGSGNFAAVEDAIISFDFVDQFHLWAGHLLVPVDRANASGPFFMIPWNYPGFFAVGNGFVGAPKEGPSGRNNGAVVWGDIQGGKFSYFAGAFDNAQVGTSPLFSGKLRLALLDPEPGFWGNGSYFGDKDLLSFSLGAQYQKHGSTSAVGDKDWADINVDGLIEKKLGNGSFVTGEGAYYHYNVNDGGISDHFFILAAYASPTVGVGNIQPMVRFQWEKIKGPGGTKPWNLDIGLSYLIKGPALRVVATYGHTDLTTAFMAGTSTSSNSIQLGAQAIFF